MCVCVCRHVHHAGHVHVAAGGGGRGGRARRRGAHPHAARALHTDARPVRVLPPGAARVRGTGLSLLFIESGQRTPILKTICSLIIHLNSPFPAEFLRHCVAEFNVDPYLSYEARKLNIKYLILQ